MTASMHAAWYQPLFTTAFALKLALVCTVVYAASFAARRFGHGVAGTLSGLPLIAGLIMGFVLLQSPPMQAHAIAVATVSAYPAMVAHMVTFAKLAKRAAWWQALLGANAMFVAVGGLLLWLDLPFPLKAILAAATPWLGLRLMPGHRPAQAVLGIPRVELMLRIAAAALLTTVLILGASPLPVAVSGLLLTVPITGNVLPCFTLARHGADATVALLRGFLHGMAGFLTFFLVLALALPVFGAGWSYALGWLGAFATALTVYAVSARKRFSPGDAGR